MSFRLAVALLIVSPAGGCCYFHNLNSADRLQAGYTIVLPGIETASYADSNIAEGLKNGGVPTAIEVFEWTTGNPARFLEHLQDLERNRIVARTIAAKIVDYQNAFPGRPVYLVGHSGGGGMTLFALEALPPGREITAAVLLAPAVSPEYDLTDALSRTERGIWNFHSSLDAILLIAGTTVAGTVDGLHTPAAGAFGFDEPAHLTDAGRQSYRGKLHQVPYHWDMALHGHLGGHFGPTWRDFSSAYLAPIICGP